MVYCYNKTYTKENSYYGSAHYCGVKTCFVDIHGELCFIRCALSKVVTLKLADDLKFAKGCKVVGK